MDNGMGWGIVLSVVAMIVIVVLALTFPKVAMITLFVIIFGGMIKTFAEGVIAGMK